MSPEMVLWPEKPLHQAPITDGSSIVVLRVDAELTAWLRTQSDDVTLNEPILAVLRRAAAERQGVR